MSRTGDMEEQMFGYVFFDLDGKRIWIQGGIVISEEF